jgi:hypothetical protein
MNTRMTTTNHRPSDLHFPTQSVVARTPVTTFTVVANIPGQETVSEQQLAEELCNTIICAFDESGWEDKPSFLACRVIGPGGIQVSGTIARIEEGRSAMKTVLAAAVATLEMRLGYSTRATVWSKAQVCSNNLQLFNTLTVGQFQGSISVNAAGFRLLEEIRASRAATKARRSLRRRRSR